MRLSWPLKQICIPFMMLHALNQRPPAKVPSRLVESWMSFFLQFASQQSSENTDTVRKLTPLLPLLLRVEYIIYYSICTPIKMRFSRQAKFIHAFKLNEDDSINWKFSFPRSALPPTSSPGSTLLTRVSPAQSKKLSELSRLVSQSCILTASW